MQGGWVALLLLNPCHLLAKACSQLFDVCLLPTVINVLERMSVDPTEELGFAFCFLLLELERLSWGVSN